MKVEQLLAAWTGWHAAAALQVAAQCPPRLHDWPPLPVWIPERAAKNAATPLSAGGHTSKNQLRRVSPSTRKRCWPCRMARWRLRRLPKLRSHNCKRLQAGGWRSDRSWGGLER